VCYSFTRSQAPAWECRCLGGSSLQFPASATRILGYSSSHEAWVCELHVASRRLEPPGKVRSQTGAWERDLLSSFSNTLLRSNTPLSVVGARVSAHCVCTSVIVRLQQKSPSIDPPQCATVSASTQPGPSTSQWSVRTEMSLRSSVPGRVPHRPLLPCATRTGSKSRSIVARRNRLQLLLASSVTFRLNYPSISFDFGLSEREEPVKKFEIHKRKSS